MKIHRILVAVLLASSGSRSHAQHTTASDTPCPLKILDSQEVDLGDHKIIYNRVETPKLKPKLKKAEAKPVEAVPLTAEDAAAMKVWEATFQYSLSLSVTVYDGKTSELRWTEDGHENVVWSNVNFLHFSQFTDLATKSANYWLMLCGSEITSEEVRALNAGAKSRGELIPLPPRGLPLLGWSGPQWIAAGKLTKGAIRAMKDFHEYYRVHGSEMAAEYGRRDAEEEAREAFERSNPLRPADSVVNFFPIPEEAQR